MSTIIETGSKGKQLKTRVPGFEDSREKIKTGVEDSRGLGFMGTDEEGDRISLYIVTVYKGMVRPAHHDKLFVILSLLKDHHDKISTT